MTPSTVTQVWERIQTAIKMQSPDFWIDAAGLSGYEVELGLGTVSRIERLDGIDDKIHQAHFGWGFCTRCLDWCLAS